MHKPVKEPFWLCAPTAPLYHRHNEAAGAQSHSFSAHCPAAVENADHHERCGWEWSHEPRLLVLTLTRFMLRKPFSRKYAVNAISHKADHYVVKDTEADSQLSIRKSLLGHWPQWATGYIIYLRVHQYSFLLGISSFNLIPILINLRKFSYILIF